MLPNRVVRPGQFLEANRRKPRDSQLLTLGRLAPEEESLRIFPFAADLERAKVLIPGAFRRLRLRFTPQFQSVQIVDGDFSLGKPFKQMVAQRGRQIGPLNPWHLFTESHAGQRFLDAFPFDRVRGRAESVRQFVEFALLGFF